ncbi:Glyoxylase, beta-lactamase superfamily II [Thermosyntropha lipolytica DSM 11003]|uniref:Glyoxylase, beta-lactamase superfamily II n=1 Tax=Thermosyntropha lipolytica DSM 11003 TaxID=1123382 RepID=A0A1M5MEJ3_9FIRM|nr:MBL fold metallo-hydrolase [Thermosyntropha lipolytica]SHG75641.1 Glyoxylase, beta-lactamase superfamily II [Thermosyntropha lipolytica DSM 11003]
MDLNIITLGITNTYIIKGKNGYVMVDAGELGRVKSFVKQARNLAIDPKKINLIIITHAHFDHIGSLADIKEICGCPVLIHPHEADILARGEVVIPPGTNPAGRMISGIGKGFKFLFRFKPVSAELRCEGEFDLRPYGVEGKVIPTPGHTPGSLSVVLDDGRAMVGDLAMNFPLTWTNYPIFAELPDEVYKSWQKIRGEGVETVYPAHGPCFAADNLIG